jgi:S1-C subfamily serine protease
MSGLSVTIDNKSLCVVHVPEGAATGFAFLRPEWVVTAKHVVVRDDLYRDPITVMFLNAASQRARVLFAHPRLDLAVLEVQGSSPCQTPLFPSNSRFTGGKGLICVGYAPSLSDKVGGRYTSFVNYVASFALDQRSRDSGDEELIVFEAPWAEQGHSGGPLLAEGGSVVGVVIEAVVLDGKPHLRGTSIHPLLRNLTFRDG